MPGIPAGVVVERATDVTGARDGSSRARHRRCRRCPPRSSPRTRPTRRSSVEALSTGAPRRALVRALAANPMVRDLDRATGLVDAILAGSPEGLT